MSVEDLRKAMQIVRDDNPDICGVTKPHVVNPRDQGWTACANCFMPVEVVKNP